MEEEPLRDVIKAVGPDLLLSSVKAGTATGVFGIGLGGVAGLFRSTTPMLFAAASGIQCSTLGTSFWAARQATLIHFARRDRVSVPDIGPRDRVLASTIAGGCSGATAAALFRGPRNVIPGTIMFSLFGWAGQTLFNSLDQREESPAAEPSAKKASSSNSSWFNPMRKLSDEEYKHMLQEKLIRVEAEIALIEESLQKLGTN